MKDILIRSVPSPLEMVTPRQAWELNAYHNNSGNVAFPFGLIRNLTTDSRAVVADWYGAKLPSAEEVNEKYDMYILPMANDFSGSRPFDKTSREFIDAVLERSSKLGLRGEITGEYLKALGYVEGSHYEVIGDATLYNLGSQMKIKDFNYSDDLNIAYNMTPKAPQSALEFLYNLPKNFENATYIPQDMGEFSKIYAGMMDPTANPLRDTIDNFPNKLTDEAYLTGKLNFFLNFPKWAEYMESVDLSIGTRIHGNVIPTHAGTPSLTMMYGSRLRELAEYHHLPRISAKDVRPDMTLAELVDGVDFHEPERYHTANFEKYVNFLDANGIDHQYRLNDQKQEFYD